MEPWNLYCVLMPFLYFGSSNAVEVTFSTATLVLEPGQNAIPDITLSMGVEENSTLEFLYQEDGRMLPYQLKVIITDLQPIYVTPNKTEYSVTVQAKAVGEMNVCLKSSTPGIIEMTNVCVYVQIVNSVVELTLAKLCGWIYVIAWSAKQIPQVYLSWKTQSVEGVSLDFVVFNTVGNTVYMLYNFLLYFIDDIRSVYKSLHPLGLFPVELNDVICSCFMAFISLFQAGQCFIYNTGNQKMSKFYTILLVPIGLFFTIILIFTLVNMLYWLTFLTALSYLKVASGPLKFIPQAKHNWERKSTDGWSVRFSWMDLIGGVCSVGQMLIGAHNEGDWGSLSGNLPKLLLGMVHIIFDTILLFQHFVLYRKDHPYQRADVNEKTGETVALEKESVSSAAKSKSPSSQPMNTPNENSKILEHKK